MPFAIFGKNAAMRYLPLLSLFFLFSCGDDIDDRSPCTGAPVAGLDVAVLDASTDAQLTAGVTVHVVSGAFNADLVLNSGHFVGLYDQQGSYELTVSKAGYQTYTEQAVIVSKPGCHSVTTTRTISLQPN